MNRKTVLLALVLAVLAGFYLLWDSTGKSDRADEYTGRMMDFDPFAVTRLEMIRPGEAIVLIRRGESWLLEAPLNDRADRFEAAEVVDSLLKMKSVKRIRSDDLSAFGLESPSIRLIVKLDGAAAGEQVRLDIGAANPAGTGRYVRLAGDTDVNLVEKRWVERLDKKLFTLRHRIVLDLDRAKAGRVVITGPKGRAEMVRTDGGWLVKSADGKTRPADPALVDRLLGSLFSHRVKAFEAQPPEGQPALVLEIEDGGGETARLELWPPEENAKLIRGRSNRQKQAFQVEAGLWSRVNLAAFELSDRRLMVYDPTAVEALEIRRTDSGEILRVEKNADGVWRIIEPADGQAGGRTIDPASAASLVYDLAELRDLAGDGPTAGDDKETPPLVVITITGRGGLAEKLELTPGPGGGLTARTGRGRTATVSAAGLKDMPWPWSRGITDTGADGG